MLHMDFTNVQDHKETLNELIEALENRAETIPRDERMNLVEEITDEYVDQVGERPDEVALSRLTNVILRDELSDPHPDKMTREEHPIMSDRQHETRAEGNRQRRKDGTSITEVPLDHAQNVATNGVDYTMPVRSFQNPF